MNLDYSPYRRKAGAGNEDGPRRFHWKRVLWGVLGVLLLLLIFGYALAGDLRFFINNYARLGFFSKNYLILLQNNYELRPGGGFVTAFGNLDTFMGIPKGLRFANSYEIDTSEYIVPPFPHEELLKNEWYAGYTFRDANWEPDFGQAAGDLIDFYRGKFPEAEVDGVIVVNFSMIEDLVGELGGIEVDGKQLNKDNLFSELEFEVNNVDRHDIEALASRKDILSTLGGDLMAKIKWHPIKFRRVAERAIANKDLYFWFDSSLQNKIAKKGWGNLLIKESGRDFLSVNLANLGAKKADRYLVKEVNHFVNIAKEIPEVTTEVVMRYPGFTNSFADNYKGYLRVIVPAEANFSLSPVDSVEEIESGLKSLGVKVALPAGGKSTFSYTYTLPRSYFERNNYGLRLVRQSGSELLTRVVVETPQGTMIESDDFDTRENRAFFSGQLVGDVDLDLTIVPDATPPYPIEHVFESLDRIAIYWSEPVSSSGADALNFEVTDLDLQDAETTDEVSVVYGEVIDGSVTRLELEGVSDQPLERYQVKVSGIKDLTGNSIVPGTKLLTVVQRLNGEGIILPTDSGPNDEALEEAFRLN